MLPGREEAKPREQGPPSVLICLGFIWLTADHDLGE
jgi:hypothetical protein